jgi:hypothetical protein
VENVGLADLLAEMRRLLERRDFLKSSDSPRISRVFE